MQLVSATRHHQIALELDKGRAAFKFQQILNVAQATTESHFLTDSSVSPSWVKNLNIKKKRPF